MSGVKSMLKVTNSLKSDFILSVLLSVLTSVKYLPTANFNYQLQSIPKTKGSHPTQRFQHFVNLLVTET